MAGRGRSKEPSRTGLARVCGDVRLAGRWGSCRTGRQVGSGIARSRARARLNWVSQGQCCGRCRVRRPCRAGESSGPGRRTAAGGSWWSRSADPRPMRAVQRARLCGHHLYRQPSAVGGEAPRGHVVQTDAVLEVSNGVLDLGVAAVVGLQFQGLSVPVGDEAVIAVGGEEGQLGTGRGLHPPDDEPLRCGAGLSLEGGVGGLRHIGGRRPSSSGTGVQASSGIASIEVPQAFVLADGDGEADIHLTTGGDESVGVEATVGPCRSCPLAPPWRTRLTVSRRKWAAPRAVLARPSRSRAISTSPVPAATVSSG